MRLLPFLLAATLLAMVPLRASDLDFPTGTIPIQFPAAANGTYAGIIVVTASEPKVPGSALLPNPPAGSVLRNRASGRLRATVLNGKIRLLGTPGSSLLGFLDEPAFASISVDAITAAPASEFLGFTARARNGFGSIGWHGGRLRLRFELPAPHLDFASEDQEIMGTRVVVIDLTKISD
jgi:hypothetical protein